MKTVDISDNKFSSEIEMMEAEGNIGERWQWGLACLRELQQLRAAKAADRERIVGEVIHHALRVMRDRDGDRRINDTERAERCVLVAGIATRVADALAVPQRPVLSEEELSQLRELRSECAVDDYPAAGPALDRLLSARPIPPLVRELVQREFCRVPAGERHDWERQRLAECLEALP